MLNLGKRQLCQGNTNRKHVNSSLFFFLLFSLAWWCLPTTSNLELYLPWQKCSLFALQWSSLLPLIPQGGRKERNKCTINTCIATRHANSLDNKSTVTTNIWQHMKNFGKRKGNVKETSGTSSMPIVAMVKPKHLNLLSLLCSLEALHLCFMNFYSFLFKTSSCFCVCILWDFSKVQ